MSRLHLTSLVGVAAALTGGCALRAPPSVSGHGPEAPGDETAVAYGALSDADPRLSDPNLDAEHDRTLLATAVCSGEPAQPRAAKRERESVTASYAGAEWDRAMNGARPEPLISMPSELDGPSATTVWREVTASAVDTQPRAFDRVSVVPVVASQAPESPLPTNLYLRDPGWGPPTSGASNW